MEFFTRLLDRFQNPLSLLFVSLGALLIVLGVTTGLELPILKTAVEPSYRWLAIALGCVFLTFAWLTNHSSISQRDFLALIETPREGEKVLHKTMCKGRYIGALNNAELWLVVKAYNDLNFHPQYHELKVENSYWEGIVYLGSSQRTDIGERFTIYLIEVTFDGGESFKNYLHNQGNGWRGMSYLPDGSILRASVTVVRQ